jgi:hypothetical protein
VFLREGIDRILILLKFLRRLLTYFLISAFLMVKASAAIYSFNTGSGATGNGVTDADGRAFRGGTTDGEVFTGSSLNGNWTSAGAGVIAVGIFSTDSLTGLTQSQLVSAFTNQFGTSFTFAAGAGGGRGIISSEGIGATVTGSPLAGKSMYLFAGNGSTLETSTQFLILKHNTSTFNAADDSNPLTIAISFSPTNTTLLFGTNVSDVRTTNTDASVTPGWAMVAPIPETSTSLLGVLGGLLMLRRSRA